MGGLAGLWVVWLDCSWFGQFVVVWLVCGCFVTGWLVFGWFVSGLGGLSGLWMVSSFKANVY